MSVSADYVEKLQNVGKNDWGRLWMRAVSYEKHSGEAKHYCQPLRKRDRQLYGAAGLADPRLNTLRMAGMSQGLDLVDEASKGRL